MTWSNIHPDADVDDDGIPRHPDDDKDHAICAHPKSDRASPPEHGRDRDDVEYCTLAAAWGVDGEGEGHCTKHGAQKTPQKGKLNPNYEHGLFAELDRSAYTERELDVLEDLGETDEVELLEQLIRIHALRYKRAHEEAPTGAIDRIVNAKTGEVRQQISAVESQLASLGGRLADLIQRHKKITEGEQINVDKKTEISGDASITVEWQVSRAELEDPDVDVDRLDDGEEIELE